MDEAEQSLGQISKLEAAEQQLETAIDLYFSGGHFSSVYTLAWASNQILDDIYSHHVDDGFLSIIGRLLPKNMRKLMATPANFLKHADRDPTEVLADISYIQIEAVLCKATILLKRIKGDLPIKMMALDMVLEEQAFDSLGLEEVDDNAARAKQAFVRRSELNAMNDADKLTAKSKMYSEFIALHPFLQKFVEMGRTENKTVSEMLDLIENAEAHADDLRE